MRKKPKTKLIYTERLPILLSREQLRKLRIIAKTREVSCAVVMRDLLNDHAASSGLDVMLENKSK
jgi:hypothetical protein